MARCKLTNMNLRSIRKSKEYQCILIDLVSAGVVEQSEAEELLGYTIPPGLLEGDTPGPDPEPEAETPVITTDLPATKTISGSDTLTIVASVTDGGALSYAWTKDGDPIADATAATLTVSEAGTYQCTVTNTLGEDTATAQSTACVVTVESGSGVHVTLAYYDADYTSWSYEENIPLDSADFETEKAVLIDIAQDTFSDATINTVSVFEPNPEYVEGTSNPVDKYLVANPQPVTLTEDMLIGCYYTEG